MRQAIRRPWRSLVLALIWLIVPEAALAHPGTGFHPEALWALLRTGLLVAVGVSVLLGVLWVYERMTARQSK